jgi:SAM-dependent methyltransferase
VDEEKTRHTQRSYDRLADEYVRRIYGELQHKPLDRQLLDDFASRVRGSGVVCDLGCGPGHVGRYLWEQGVEVCGIDLSIELVERARRLNPGIDFQQGDLFELGVKDAIWAGIIAFYSIIHAPSSDHVLAFCEMRRVLRPGGLVLVAFHVGEQVLHFDELWGQNVFIDFYLFRSSAVADALRSAGFEVEKIIERDPYPDVEAQTRRAYILASVKTQRRDGKRIEREGIKQDSAVS